MWCYHVSVQRRSLAQSHPLLIHHFKALTRYNLKSTAQGFKTGGASLCDVTLFVHLAHTVCGPGTLLRHMMFSFCSLLSCRSFG